MAEKVLITGGSGFLGSALVPEFQQAGSVVSLGHRQTRGAEAMADLRRRESVEEILRAVKPDLVIHAAAYRDPDYCEMNPVESGRLNVGSTKHLVDLLPKDTHFVYISSDYVFDGARAPYAEYDVRNPVNVYGQQKVSSEDLVSQRVNSTIIRMPVLIGRDLPDKPGFITKMKETIEDHQRESVLDDVLIRFPTWIEDVAKAVRFLGEQRVEGVFHASADQGGTRYGLNREMADYLGASFDHVQPSREVVCRGAKRPADTQLTTEKLDKLGFSGFRSFSEVLELLDW